MRTGRSKGPLVQVRFWCRSQGWKARETCICELCGVTIQASESQQPTASLHDPVHLNQTEPINPLSTDTLALIRSNEAAVMSIVVVPIAHS